MRPSSVLIGPAAIGADPSSAHSASTGQAPSTPVVAAATGSAGTPRAQRSSAYHSEAETAAAPLFPYQIQIRRLPRHPVAPACHTAIASGLAEVASAFADM
jgi:hypothetical protein